MSRILPLLTVLVACTLAACGDDENKVQILVFQASPDAIEAGQSTKLVFAVQPASAKVSISGLGDVTGKTEAQVSPAETTSYQLTATNGKATTNETVQVTVGATSAASIKIQPASKTPTAGEPFTVALTVLGTDGNVAPGFRGTVHIASTDTSAVLPQDIAFTANEAGAKTVNVTLKTAGGSTLTATDATGKANAAGAALLTVQPAAARSYQLRTHLPASATAGDSLKLTIAVHDAFGNLATPYGGKIHLTSTDSNAVLPPDSAFTAGAQTVIVTFTTTGNRVVTVADAAGPLASVTTATVAVGPAVPSRLVLSTPTTATTAGAVQPVTVTVTDRFGNPSTNYTGTVHFTATDASAMLPGDFTFAPGDAGKHDFTVTLKTAGTTNVTAADGALGALTDTKALTVSPAAASTYVLNALPASAIAGQGLVLTVAVQDAFGNVVTSYGGQAQVTSADATDQLPASGGFTGGVRTVSLAFTKAGAHTATVVDPAGVIGSATTSSVAVSAASPFRVAVTTSNNSVTAGATETVTTKIVDFFDNTCLSYTGTLHFAATDPQAVVPPDTTFGPGDAGLRDFNVTLRTSGTTTLAISDTAAAGLSGSATWKVGAGNATTCVASQAPTAAPAGTVVGLTVAVRDTFGNTADGYAGTIALTATDARANLPGNVTYVPASDAGSHAFSVALLTTGDQTVTATDVVNPAIACTLGIKITPAAPKLVVTLPTDANAGFPVSVGVAVKDLFDNAIPNFAGTVSFTSTDNGAGAAPPGDLTFTGTENGVATTTATFVTLGAQTLSGTATGIAQFAGSAVARVHGLAYTAPATGKVRLIANAAQSNTQVVQFDLVASERLVVSTFFGGPGSFSAGMNLPLDTTRVGAGSPLFTRGAALPAGAGVPASVGMLGPDHVLYTGVSRKRIANPANGPNPVALQDTEVQAGQVFYSVKLKLTQNGTPGTVFDGAQPMAAFRAAVRDQFGDDFVGQSDFGIGKLEIR
jgi:hypothetical protein